MLRRLRTPVLAVLATATVVAATAAGRASAAPSQDAQSPPQQITVERPAGQVVLSELSVDSGGQLRLTVTDTRADDPGWAVSVSVSSKDGKALGWKPALVDQTQPFTTPDGTSYGQQVVAGSAPAGHGLGIARLGAKLTTGADTASDDDGDLEVTVTVV
jgi:hypothetical protein